MACALCGERTAENMLRVKDGKPVCLECAGLI
ncbi:MAG: TraR/DksA C4-type zinc finger protein [Firmicutes bacterium]|nr:TraR/DksA C4-type zinc finger protein [Bacillota bacterium]